MAPHLILFDGVCPFCNGAVNFILSHDPSGTFVFSPLQSADGKQSLELQGIASDRLDTLVLIKNGQTFVRSDAVLEIAKDLPGPWCLLRVFRVVPRPLRDLLYRLMARYRYVLFGKRATCRVPSPKDRDRFLPKAN
ncbi:MAG: thiol-disulfide oxidoreductase DCC family protein [Fibrobacteres bacterium]|nr:thiol-disulfide oxidoreductase DCC family protein [Fibrobacterota bacterium]